MEEAALGLKIKEIISWFRTLVFSQKLIHSKSLYGRREFFLKYFSRKLFFGTTMLTFKYTMHCNT